MEPEEKGIIARVLTLATGITAITTIFVLSSVAGMNAYLAYQPSALEAQVITPVSETFPPAATIISTSTATTSSTKD